MSAAHPGTASSSSAALVSVIVPAFNASAFVRQTLDSVLAQTYRDFEVIVVDDGSTDETPQILDGYRDQVCVLRQSNAGQAAARNRGISRARGELLAFLDSDDLWDPEKLTRQVELLGRFPEAVATYCDHRTVDGEGCLISTSGALGFPRASGDIRLALLMGSRIVTPSLVLVRRQAFTAAGGFDESAVMRGHEDSALWLCLAMLGSILYSPETLVSYRRHSSQATRQPHYELRMARARLRGLLGIRDAVLASEDANVKGLFRWILGESRLSAAWAARQMGDPAEARQLAAAALAHRPMSLRAWRTLVAAMFPRRAETLGL